MRPIAPRSAVRLVVAAAATLAQPAAAVAQPAPGVAQPAPPGVAQPAPGVAQPAPGVAQPAPPAVAQPAPGDLRRAGAEALEAGRLGEALALYERALGPTRSDPRVWFDLCLVRYSAGDYGRAFNACYRALPAHQSRVVALLERIAAAMRASGVRPGRLIVPDPDPRWYSPDRWLSEALLSSEEPPAGAGAVRAIDPEPAGAAGAADVIAAARLDYVRGPRPPLPYHVPGRADDYGAGLDFSARGGLLFYAPDTAPLVGGVRAEWRRREHGTSTHDFYFAEYLHALDETGGIGAAGLGGRGRTISGSIGLSVPWGRSEGRRDVLIPDHTLALHGEVRLGVFRDVMVDRSWALSFEGGLVAGLNLAKAAIRIGNKFSDACGSQDGTDCPETPDANPGWPLGHFMIQIGVSLGFRGGHPRYDRPEVFAPMGGS